MRTGALAAFLLVAACGPSGPTGPPRRVLLVTLDTTRTDHLGAYGRTQAATPTIDRLAREGILFERAQTPVPITLPAHASILTGVYPSAHGVHDNGVFRLSDEGALVSEVLARRGFRTGAFVGSYILDAKYGLDQGFEVYDAPDLKAETGHSERPAGEVVDAALRWFEGVTGDESYFAWVHFYDPHFPHRAEPGYEGRFETAYDAEIAYCDAQLARLLNELESRGLAQDLLTIVTSDHGEDFGEHGEANHGIFLFQCTMSVPLVLHGPQVAAAAGTRSSTPVSTVSLPATILTLLGLSPDAMPSMKVAPLLQPDGRPVDAPPADLYLETLLPYHSHRWHPYLGMVSDRHKLIRGKGVELYDLVEDPAETNDLAVARPELAADLEQRLERLLREHAPLDWSSQGTVGADDLGALEALGYAGGSVAGDPFDGSLPDPRERLGDQERLYLVRQLMRSTNESPAIGAAEQGLSAEARERLGQALSILEELEAGYAANPQVVLNLGAVKLALEDPAGALPYNERAAQENPYSPTAQFTLAMNYLQLARTADAERAFRTVHELDPRFVRPYPYLALLHSARGEHGHASWWLQRMLDVLGDKDPLRWTIKSELNEVERQRKLRGQDVQPPADLGG